MSLPLTSAHWGTYRVETAHDKSLHLRAFEKDGDPSPIGDAMLETRTGATRIAGPVVRRGFLENGFESDQTKRGRDAFVSVDWDQALDLVARELDRVRDQFGNEAIYAGSYGWASAGRFHHAQSQLRRFMNLFGGATTSRNSYSYAAAEVILPHVVGAMSKMLQEHTSWRSIAETKSLVVCFGGLALRNSQVNSGGTGRHSQRQDMKDAYEAGASFINVSPQKADTTRTLKADWLPLRPNTDLALMLALAHTLVSENRYDKKFIDRYCVGFDAFQPYLMGHTDGQPKDATWAARITGIKSEKIIELAHAMAARPTFVNASWSLTRQHNGDQVYWMAVVLAALLGGIGKPGEGFGVGLGAVNSVGSHRAHVPWAALPTGQNPVSRFIPVARIADMLLGPGEAFTYNGQSHTYPDVRLVYWAGGNPFHHHQDLNRLRRAWQKIETVIVHEPFWTATAKQADIVLPTTIGLERNDLAASPRDNFIVASRKVVAPYGDVKNDFDIYVALARRLKLAQSDDEDFEAAFTDGLNEDQWLQRLYAESRERAKGRRQTLPDYETFVEAGVVELKVPGEASVLLQGFRKNPKDHPLDTPSGKIEIFSEKIAGYGLKGVAGHPQWSEPPEWLGGIAAQKHPLHLITHQPERRLHSQLDASSHSRAGKIKGREPCLIHPDDARSRGIKEGDIVRLYNDRGACLSAAKLDEGLHPGVLMMATGAWYDPDWEKNANQCKHGNPNTLTADVPNSLLVQGPSALTCLVEIEPVSGKVNDVSAFEPPEIIRKNGSSL